MTNSDAPAAGGWQARVRELVDPFYLDVMGVNARSVDAELVDAFVAVGATVSAAETISLLRTAWRETVMGAWYSLFVHDPDAVVPELLQAMENSYGARTAPPLAVASTMLAGRDAVPAMQRYVERDLDGEPWGAAGFVAAAVEHAGGRTRHAVTPDDRVAFQDLSRFGQSLTWN